MVLFYVKKEFFEALRRGEKKAELRIGESWVKAAEKIKNGKLKPVAFFRWGNKVIIREIYDVRIYPSISKALANGRWKLLGLKAKTYPEAIDEVRKLYTKGGKGRAVLFLLRKPKDMLREGVLKEIKKIERLDHDNAKQ